MSPRAIPVLEIGGTHVTAALVDPAAARAVARVREPLDAQGGREDILGAITGCAHALVRQAGTHQVAGAVWGVAVPGPFDYATGLARFAGVGKFDALYGVDLRARLLTGLPGRPRDAVFLNDAHAFLVGEWRAGTARGHDRCVGVTLGTGVGSAFLAEGRVCHEGPGVPPDGRVDLLRSGGLPLEETVSRRAIRARYDDPDADVDVIAARARLGEPRARRVLDEAFTALGRVLGPCLDGFRASVLVVGGSMTGSWDLVGPALRAGLEPHLTPGRTLVRPGALAEDAALTGAAAFAAAL